MAAQQFNLVAEVSADHSPDEDERNSRDGDDNSSCEYGAADDLIYAGPEFRRAHDFGIENFDGPGAVVDAQREGFLVRSEVLAFDYAVGLQRDGYDVAVVAGELAS